MTEESDWRVLAVDPGKTTGVATYDNGVFRSIELGDAENLQFFSYITDFNPSIVICEAFRITAQTAKNTQAPWSLELIGVSRLAAKIIDAPFVLQTPADAKRFATDKKLHALDWFRPSKGGHQNDAARHLLTALVKYGWMDERLYQ